MADGFAEKSAISSSFKMVFTSEKANDSSMDEDYIISDSETSPRSTQRSLLSRIKEERSREYFYKDGYLVVDHMTSWKNLFSRHFVESSDDIQKDDMLFYIRKVQTDSEFHLPQLTVEVFRKCSTCKPSLSDTEIDWEETVYLNFILQHFEYYITCAICSRSSNDKPIVLNKLTQKVYPSPSGRRMDRKGTEEEITYPSIYFTIDNFEEAFANQIVQENEMVSVELVAIDNQNFIEVPLFRGSISFEALKKVYDKKGSLTHRMSLSWFRESNRVEFIKMSGPNGKGCAEMAVSHAKTTESMSSQILTNESFAENIEDPEYHYSNRRLSDPNSSTWKYLFRGSLKGTTLKKCQSNVENLGLVGALDEKSFKEETNNISKDAPDQSVNHLNSATTGKLLSQTWHRWKEQRNCRCTALNSFLTSVALPWHQIIADICGENSYLPIYFFSRTDLDERH